MPEPVRRTLLIGMGNPYRQDDGVGPYVIRKLVCARLPGVETAVDIGDSLQLLARMQDFEQVLLIDAMAASTQPGKLLELDGLQQPLHVADFFVSSHVLSIAEAIALGRKLDRLPRVLRVYGIEGQLFGHGDGLSAPVRQSADRLVIHLQTILSDSPQRQSQPA